jgi:hypothetical protein
VVKPTPGEVSEWPLWVIGLMFAFHLAWLAFCALWIPTTFGDAIARRFGSPVFVLPAIIVVYATAPLVASFSKLGRDYWDLLGRGGSARRATVMLLVIAALSALLALGVRYVVQ